MIVIKLLEELNRKGIKLNEVDGQLRISAEEGKDLITKEIITEIKNNKEMILDYLRSGGKIRTSSDLTLPDLNQEEYRKLLEDNALKDYEVEDIYNLTPLQEGFLFHSMMDKDSTAYFEQFSLDLSGVLDLEIFEETWQRIGGRHDVLRTMFVSDFRVPVQIVLKNRKIGFSSIDIRGEGDKEKRINNIKLADRENNFDLKHDPLFRVNIVRSEDEKYTMIISFQHIILDGWCISFLFSEFLHCYSKLLNKEKIELGLAPLYSSYIKWMNSINDEDAGQYWKSYLEGYKDVSSIPEDYNSGYSGIENQINYSFVIDEKQTNIIKELANELGVTLNTLIQTIWGIILSRYNNMDDVVFGSIVSGRPQEIPRIGEMVGLFINTIPVRIKIDKNKSFREIVLNVQQEGLESMKYQHSSLAEIQSDNGLNNKLLDHIMVFENLPVDNTEKAEDFSTFKIDNLETFEQINYNFGITILPSDTILFKFSYNPEKYREISIKRIQSHFEKTFDEIIFNKDAKIGEIDIIPDEEKNFLLNVFNDTKTDYPAIKTIIDLFEEQVRKTPDNIAVVYENVELSYRELNEKANIVGHYLRDIHDVKPDDLVGVLLDRSEKLIISFLGILKSGAAYVPIDPDYPQERIDFMLEDSNPTVVISNREEDLFANINEILGYGSNSCNLENNKNPDNLAYVIYTSGSTGKPKGVIIQERCIVNFLFAFSGQFENGITENDNFISIVNTSFDVSVCEIFSSLLFGASLFIYKNITLELNEYCRYLEDNKITFAYIHPGLLKDVAKGLDKEKIALNKLLVGVEGIQDTTLNEYLDLGNIQIINGYGPTEDTICATFFKYSSKTQTGRNVSIGSPVSNTQIYILDKDRNLNPLGVSGELCISGSGLAWGYLNRPELTAAKFVDNPFMTGERMYRTGDLARWLPDGNIEFLGRIDNQVKIRGFRVELGEIENSLVQYDRINSAVVLAKEGTGGYKQLIAYYSSGKELEASELINFLAKSLPVYMIPSYFIYMEVFPLTTNGKIDRKALPGPDGTFHSGVEYIAPRNKTEEILTSIWQEILGIERIGILDNFFELGGHSLKATRVVSSICRNLEVEISIKDIFSNPTIESLSKIISKSVKNDYCQIDTIPKQDSYELSNSQKRLWILNQLEDEGVLYNIPVAFYLVGKFNEDLFRKAYSFIIERHESLRTVFITDNGEPRQIILEKPELFFKVIDLRCVTDNEVKIRKIAEKDIQTSFNLEEGPLVRFSIIQLEDDKSLLLFNMHHIISDGWSMNILTREFLDAYNNFRGNQNPDLKPLGIQYKDYAAWQNSFLVSSEIDEKRDYWVNKLSGELPVLSLPSDNIRPSIQTFNGDSIDLLISEEVASGLYKLCNKKNVSLFMMLQALVKVLFHRYTGQENIILGSPIAGRNREDLENQIGFYISTLVFRDTVLSDLRFDDFLESVKQTCIEAFENQDYPFDRLVDELDLKRDLSRAPLFDVMLVLQNNETTDLKFDGMTISPYKAENLISKYDMTFNFSEEEGLFCRIEYNTDIYSEDRVNRMAIHLKTLISSVIEKPQTRVKDLEIISVEERNYLLKVFNDTKTEYPADKSIAIIFEEQVENTPDNIAIVFKDLELTYRELNVKANIVAHYLRDNYDIKPDDFIGVLLEKSQKMIIALLGILKSGAAYVPIDPGYPVDRVEYILEDSNPRVVIGDRTTIQDSNIGLIDIDDLLQFGKNIENPEHESQSGNLAYIIYTSGSTGRPKGTLIEQKSVTRVVRNTNYIDIRDEDVVLQLSNYAFDGSIFDIYGSLLNGSKLVLIDKDDVSNINSLSNIILTENVSVFFVTTALFNILVETNLESLRNIRKILFGGEQCSPGHITKAFEYLGNNKIIHVYGPTESTVYATYYEINKIANDKSLTYPIGSPISNTSVFILDGNKNPAPIGVSGELCISGAGLARGYLNKPELTNEMFVDNPFVSGDRMYKTGDLARWLTDGNIEFLGRIDNQVKIRGFRIEPGEIESSLLEHDSINAAVVITKDGIDGEKQLVSYIVSGKELDLLEIRNFLKKSLPGYMIPSFFIQMESLPLNSNGKIDKKGLPDPDFSVNTGEEYIAPRNNIEEKLVGIWQEVLGVEKIGINENFFELGGHSLKATRVVSKISRELEVAISLKDIFEKPTVGALSGVISSSVKSEYKRIEAIRLQETCELSNAQRRLWILDQYEEDSIAYNMPASFILKGELDIDYFNQAFSFMLERHESLRTVFVSENGEPRQKILTDSDSRIEIIDLRGNPDAGEEAKILGEKDLMTPFNLESGPLVRFSIIRIEDDKTLLLFNMHHIISDGWSMNIFIGEFLGCYNSFKDGNTPDLQPLRIHYKDYSVWQNDLLESGEIKDQREYWLEKLSGELPVLDLPSDKARPASQTFNGSSINISFPEDTQSALNDLCRENNISLFMMLQALVKVLFYRYTGQTDIILGSPVAGRVHEDLEDQIGFYVNTLIFRDLIDGDLPFGEFLENVGKTCTEAFDNQDYPFDKIVEDLDIKRDMSRSALFDVMVVLQNNESSSVEFEGLELLPYVSDGVISKFDMTFSFSEGEEALYCGIEYNMDIYSDDRIRRMGEHLGTLISSVLENPEAKVKDLEIIPEEERNLLLNVFNDTKADYPADRTIVDLFEEQVRETPDNIAVVFEDVELTYRELNEKANIIGYYLRANYQIEPDDLVGVMLERSERMIIALLGILKSGAAYVPIDPGYPQDRINYMLEDSSPKVVLSDREGELLLDINIVLEDKLNTGNQERLANSSNLAYVIYTSGSTGNPKGVPIEHKSIGNTLLWRKKYYNYGKTDVILQFVSYSFDSSVEDIFTALISGSRLIEISYMSKSNISLLIDIIKKHNVTNISLIPDMYDSLLSYDSKILDYLRKIVVGGDKISNSLINHHFEQKSDAILYNEYGPTENSVCTTVFKLESDKNLIGKPISNSRVFILDDNQGLLPQGIPGELCISGDGLARGYLNRPDLTADSFVDNPLLTGERMYKTGDFARWLPDGNIEFLGRIDNQVKIRGFRIESGEIENVLLKHIEIVSALVLAKEVTDGEKSLVAYYVSGKELDIPEMRNFLKKYLPEYMVPSFFIHMESFPLTPSGKVDRKALPEPDGHYSTGVEYIAPRNKIEEELVGIWQEVLGVERIGIHDNFFELGGHSLKATRVVSKISRELEVNISLRDIFENPTVEALSGVINSSVKSEYKKIEVIPEQDTYELSNAQRRLWILDQYEKGSIAYNMPATFILKGELDIDSFNQAYSFIVERHESLRTVFVTDNGDPMQMILSGSDFRIEIIDLRGNPNREEDARIFAEKDLMTPFILETGPPVRFSIIRIEDDKNLLLFNMHHIISDGWSMSIFISEFLNCYNNFKNGETPDLKPLRIHYKDYSAWQNNLLESEEIKGEKEYWCEKLSGELPVLDLPSDKVRPVFQTFNGSSKKISFPKEMQTALNDICMRNKVSLFMILQALVKVLFYRYTGQSDIILGSPVAGRVHEDLEDQIGFYVNTLIFRDTIEGDLSFKEILSNVKRTCTEAFDNQDYPFDMIVEDLDIKRDLSRSPLFDVMLVLQNNESTTVEFEGLELFPYEGDGVISKFDMTFNFSEGEEGLFCSIEYNTDIYSVERIERMGEHLITLISSVIDNTEAKVKDFNIIPEDEKNLLLNIFNDTKADYPSDRTIVDLFEEQVEKTPDNIAVVFEDVELTYRELNEKVNIIGHYLRDNFNIKPDDLVGIMLDRSEKIIIAILGILKSGGAYVPIDPEYPKDRISYMLQDSNPKVVLSDRNDNLLVDINFILDSISNCENPKNITEPENIAYVIYTSGSTGKPKGVIIENRSLLNLFYSLKNSIYKNYEDILNISLFASFSFDASVQQIFSSILLGHKLHIIPDDFKSDSGKLLDYYFDNKIDILDGTPVLVDLISDKLGESSINLKIKELIIGGDVLSFPSVNQLVKKMGSNNIPKITNVYGPTECCVDSTLYNYLITDNTVTNIIPIGKPLFNTKIFILDKDLELVSIGVAGELCISGHGIARGYLNRDDLTAEKFIDNPYIPGERMYRTGDLARWQQDGNIEFLGRIDNQVKIRGFRIELGEIENLFVQHKDIGSAVVVAKTALDGDKQLIAYYYGQKELEVSDIRAYLGESLPGYMIPSYFVYMESFPLTPNGKIDRKALPEPGGFIKTGVEYIAPRNNIEEKLVEIWQEVLGIEKIGVLDNFFDLGGHSLKAVKLVSRIYKDFSYQLQLRGLFEKSTVSELAELINSDNENNIGRILVPIQVKGARNPIFLVPGSMGDVLCFSSLSKCLGEDQPVYGLQAVGLDGISKPIDNIEEMAESYIQSIKSVQEKGPYQLGGHSFGGLVAFEICRQLEILGDEIELLMLFDSYPDKSGELEFNEENQFLSFLNQISKLYDIDLDIDKITDIEERERWNYVDRIFVENEIHLPIEMIKGKWDVNKINCTMRSFPQVQLSLENVIQFNAREGRILNNGSGWDNYFTTEVNTYEISGNHFSMLEKPNVEEIVDVLKELEDVDSRNFI